MKIEHKLWRGFLASVCSVALLGFAAGNSVADEAVDVTRLACVGDSITAGTSVSDRETKTYPALLKSWMGPKWDVQNFGANGSTLLQKGNLPYAKRPHFRKALDFKPDVVVIALGTNDSRQGSDSNPKIPNNWQYKADFVGDYKALLAEFKKANPKVKFYLGLSVPSFPANRYGIDDSVVKKEIHPLVHQIAAEEKAQVIDLYSPLDGKPTMFRDRVHPNDAGTRIMAETVYRALTGKEAPATTDETVAVAPVLMAPVAPFAANIKAPVKENFHLYLLMGQSNMVGRDTLNPATPNNPRLLSLNKEGQWEIAKDPLHFQEGRIAPGVGPGISFAQEMLNANPNVTIGLIPCAVGGTSLGRWVKGADLYEKAVNLAKIAGQTGTLKGVLWHQGESDTTYPKKAQTYGKTASTMFKNLRADLDQNDLPIVVGQLGEFLKIEKQPYVEGVRAALKALPQQVAKVGFADSKGLGHKGDSVHFSAEAEKEMGVRFAQAMQQLQKQ